MAAGGRRSPSYKKTRGRAQASGCRCPASPRAARLNASVMCVTGSSATKVARRWARRRRESEAARSAASVTATRRSASSSVAAPSQPVKTLSIVVSAGVACADRTATRGQRGLRASGRRVASVCQTPSRVEPSACSRCSGRRTDASRGRTETAASPVLASVSLSASVARASHRRRSANRLRCAKRPRPCARGSSPARRVRAEVARSSPRAPRRVHGRCQPTPWIECG